MKLEILVDEFRFGFDQFLDIEGVGAVVSQLSKLLLL